MAAPKRQPYLEPVDLFEGVPASLSKLALSNRKTLRKGSQLFQEDKPADAMYYIEEGIVEISKNQTTLVQRMKGWLVGEQAFVEELPHTATATVATDPATVYEISRKVVEKLFANNQFLKNLQKSLSHKLSQTVHEEARRYNRELQLIGEFQAHVAPRVMDELLEHGIDYGAPRNINGVVLFSDIRSFTKLSSTVTPQRVAKDLGAYLDKVVEVIHKHDGLVDKFIGDAVMAVWGYRAHPKTPGDQKQLFRDDIDRSVRCSMEMIKVARKNKFAGQLINIGVGIECGKMFIGNIGSAGKKQFTVLGQPANLASRYESLTKTLKCNVVIGQALAQQLQPSLKGVFSQRTGVDIAGYDPREVWTYSV